MKSASWFEQRVSRTTPRSLLLLRHLDGGLHLFDGSAEGAGGAEAGGVSDPFTDEFSLQGLFRGGDGHEIAHGVHGLTLDDHLGGFKNRGGSSRISPAWPLGAGRRRQAYTAAVVASKGSAGTLHALHRASPAQRHSCRPGYERLWQSRHLRCQRPRHRARCVHQGGSACPERTCSSSSTTSRQALLADAEHKTIETLLRRRICDQQLILYGARGELERLFRSRLACNDFVRSSATFSIARKRLPAMWPGSKSTPACACRTHSSKAASESASGRVERSTKRLRGGAKPFQARSRRPERRRCEFEDVMAVGAAFSGLRIPALQALGL